MFRSVELLNYLVMQIQWISMLNFHLWLDFVSKIILWEKKCSSDLEKLLKFKAEGQEFAKLFRSLEPFILTVKGQYNF